MDWARAIKINRNALIAIVAAIFRMLRIEADDAPERLPRHLHQAALRILRPAESAARRLIIIATRGLAVQPLPAARHKPANALARKAEVPNAAGRSRVSRLSFRLYDPRKNFKERRRKGRRVTPRIAIIDYDSDPLVSILFPRARPVREPVPQPEEDGQINAAPLCRRLYALKSALEDVPRQARRLMRWQASRQRIQTLRPVFATPLRPGYPPGHRRKPMHEVDHVLRECDSLAFHAMKPDTS
jgi:hypothetical protein